MIKIKHEFSALLEECYGCKSSEVKYKYVDDGCYISNSFPKAVSKCPCLNCLIKGMCSDACGKYSLFLESLENSKKWRYDMTIRRKLDESYESLSTDIKPFREMFLGNITGIVLRERKMDENDPHIVFEIISEDDGHWFKYTGSGASSYWLDDYINVLTEVKKWLEENAEPDIEEGIQYGWKFKE